MDIINFGSLNLDYVYHVDHFVRPGETMAAREYHVFCGGKGLNQSVAAARAGARVFHAGAIGAQGGMLRDMLTDSGVDVSYLAQSDQMQGHANIQVSAQGENCIILFQGSNFTVTRDYIDQVLSDFRPPAFVMLQNEISNVDYAARRARDMGFSVVLNASPIDEKLLAMDFSQLDWLMINEIEGGQITGRQEPEEILDELATDYPNLGVVLTLGEAGVICRRGKEWVEHGIYQVPVVDTTAAGDTFSGYFVASLARGEGLEQAVRKASLASALAVSRHGAAPSIPTAEEVEQAEPELRRKERDK